jgi:hypothetical protein
MQQPDMTTYKLLFLSFAALVSLAVYMVLSHDTSSVMVWSAVALGAFFLVVSIFEIRRDAWAYLQMATVAVLAVAIFAGVTWWYSKIPLFGQITAVAAPLALGFSVWSVLGKRKRA